MSWRDDPSFRSGNGNSSGSGHNRAYSSSYRGRTERHPQYNSRARGPGRPGGIDEGGGAAKLARIHGTELDRINCPYYFKVGACRHGEKCSRRHNKPKFSQTLLVKHMWLNPQVQFLNVADHEKPGEREMREFNEKVQERFNAFYEEVFAEAAKFGYMEALHVTENLGDHMVGNVYIKYEDEVDAASAMEGLQGRYYSGQQLLVEFSPVSDFTKARCRQYDDGVCTRGGFCNYVHIRQPDRRLVRCLFEEQVRPKQSDSDSSSSSEDEGDGGKSSSHRSRRRSRSRSRSRDRKSRRHSSGSSTAEGKSMPTDPIVSV